jgi:hypothetical protein
LPHPFPARSAAVPHFLTFSLAKFDSAVTRLQMEDDHYWILKRRSQRNRKFRLSRKRYVSDSKIVSKGKRTGNGRNSQSGLEKLISPNFGKFMAREWRQKFRIGKKSKRDFTNSKENYERAGKSSTEKGPDRGNYGTAYNRFR